MTQSSPLSSKQTLYARPVQLPKPYILADDREGHGSVTGRAGKEAPSLGAEELARYSRHLLLAEIGENGQNRLKSARVAIVGIGGLGCPAAIYLAAAGVGTLGLVDADRVDASNLQRQVLFTDEDVGRPKVYAARARLATLNPFVRTEAHHVRLVAGNALEVLRGYDLVIDATDNFPSRYLINDASVLLDVPNIHGSVLRFEGRVSVFGATDGPCYRCLFPLPPPPDTVPDCADAGVLGVLPGLVGVLQATEAIKWITGVGTGLSGRLLLIDALGSRFQTITVGRDPACPVCGTRVQRELIDYDAFCGTAQPAAAEVQSLSPVELAGRLRAPEKVQLVDVREPWEWGIAHLPEARLVPMDQVHSLVSVLDPARETVLYCHHGARSLAAAQHLVSAGFSRVAHLDGGIERWSVEVDPSLRRY